MTDEPRVEIASCPVQGCGGECIAEALMGAVIRVRCLKCGYGLDGFLSVADAIAAHNALCADVRRGRDAAKIEQERDATAQGLRRENGELRAEASKQCLLKDMYLQAGGDAADERNVLRNALTEIANRIEYLIKDADLLDRTTTIRAIGRIARAALDAGRGLGGARR